MVPSADKADATAEMQRLQAKLPEGLVLQAPLGKGGMGQVFVAQDLELGEVVVKVMHAHLAPQNAERLRLEAEALAKLRSPYIVQLHRWGVAGGRPYLVMERLMGHSLEALMADGPLPPPRALQIARDVCLGLSVVHGAKVVHRDIKPDNVFVCEDRAVLLDFGVVKLIENVTGVAPLQHPTSEGAAVGTPRYMAPEQARARPVDGRADLYSLGVILFRMLTGEHLFTGNSLKDLLLDHVMTPPRRASDVAPHPLPTGIDEVLLKTLAKSRDDRPNSAAELAAVLESLQPGLADTRIGGRPVVSALQQTVMLDPGETGVGGTVAMKAPYTHPMPEVAPSAVAPEPVSSVAVTEAWDGPPPAQVQTEAWEQAEPVASLAAATPGSSAPRRWTWPLVVAAAILAFVIAVALADRVFS